MRKLGRTENEVATHILVREVYSMIERSFHERKIPPPRDLGEVRADEPGRPRDQGRGTQGKGSPSNGSAPILYPAPIGRDPGRFRRTKAARTAAASPPYCRLHPSQWTRVGPSSRPRPDPGEKKSKEGRPARRPLLFETPARGPRTAPGSLSAMQSIPGIGASKLERYGQSILEALRGV